MLCIVLACLVADPPAPAVPEDIRLKAVAYHREVYDKSLADLRKRVADARGAGLKGKLPEEAKIAAILKEPQKLFAKKKLVGELYEIAPRRFVQGSVGWHYNTVFRVAMIGPEGTTLTPKPDAEGKSGLSLFLAGKPPKGAVVGGSVHLPRTLYFTGERRRISDEHNEVEVAHLIEFTPEELAALPK